MNNLEDLSMAIKLPLPSKETYAHYSAEAKLDTVYDLLTIALENQQEVIRTMQKRRKIDTTVASALGLAGGFMAVFLKSLIPSGRS